MIYIIDDDPFVRRAFKMLLTSAGYENTTLGSAIEYLESYKLCEHDLVILDLHMPGMNGCELLEQLSKQGIHIPIIIVTAYDEPFSRECAKKYGAIAYLRKPIDSEALLDLIKYCYTADSVNTES